MPISSTPLAATLSISSSGAPQIQLPANPGPPGNYTYRVYTPFHSVILQEWLDLHIIKDWPFPASELATRGFHLKSFAGHPSPLHLCLFPSDITPNVLTQRPSVDLEPVFLSPKAHHLRKKAQRRFQSELAHLQPLIETETVLAGRDEKWWNWRLRGSVWYGSTSKQTPSLRFRLESGADIFVVRGYLIRERQCSSP